MKTHFRQLAGTSVFLILIAAMAAATGCSNPKPAGFVKDPDQMKKDKRYPFNLVWVDEEHIKNKHKYKTIHIAPISTEHLLDNPWYQDYKTAYALSDYEKDVAEIAEFMHEEVVKAFKEYPKSRLKVVDKPGADTIVLELALVELVPNEPTLVAVGYIVPGPTMMNQPSVGMEGRVRVAATDETVVTMASRRRPDWSVVDLQNLRSFWDADKDVIRAWAQLLAQVANDQYDADKLKLPVKLIAF